MGQGFLDIAGLHDDVQQAGWARVADAVHAAGDAKLVIQLMHCGRVAHPVYTGGVTPIAPSALRHEGTVRTPAGNPRLRDAARDRDRRARRGARHVRAGGAAGGGGGCRRRRAARCQRLPPAPVPELEHEPAHRRLRRRRRGPGPLRGRDRRRRRGRDRRAPRLDPALARPRVQRDRGADHRRRRTTRCCARSPGGISCTST